MADASELYWLKRSIKKQEHAMLLRRPDPTEGTRRRSHSLYACASEEHTVEEATRLLEEGANVNERRGTRGLTPLHACAEAGRLDLVCQLLNHGAILDAEDNFGNTPFMLCLEARAADFRDVATLLIAAGANVNHCNRFGRTPLYFAGLAKDRAMVRDLGLAAAVGAIAVAAALGDAETCESISIAHRRPASRVEASPAAETEAEAVAAPSAAASVTSALPIPVPEIRIRSASCSNTPSSFDDDNIRDIPSFS